jgi:3-methyl-2-oxobutanoate hydroxymethyltransferase
MAKKTVADLQRMKRAGERIAWMTCYDFPMARLAEQAGLDMLLVGDSAGKAVWGYTGAHRVGIEQMLVITEAVRRGAPDTFVVGDLPFMSFATAEAALANAARFYRETGCDAVILEGGRAVVPQVEAIAGNGMRVMGHLGLTPLGTSRLETAEDVAALIEDATALERAGAFAILVGFCPAEVCAAVRAELSVPLLGSGSGPHTDGELQAITDIIGTFPLMPPAMAAKYADLGAEMVKAFAAYVRDVKGGAFPGDKGIRMDPQEAARLDGVLAARRRR